MAPPGRSGRWNTRDNGSMAAKRSNNNYADMGRDGRAGRGGGGRGGRGGGRFSRDEGRGRRGRGRGGRGREHSRGGRGRGAGRADRPPSPDRYSDYSSIRDVKPPPRLDFDRDMIEADRPLKRPRAPSNASEEGEILSEPNTPLPEFNNSRPPSPMYHDREMLQRRNDGFERGGHPGGNFNHGEPDQYRRERFSPDQFDRPPANMRFQDPTEQLRRKAQSSNNRPVSQNNMHSEVRRPGELEMSSGRNFRSPSPPHFHRNQQQHRPDSPPVLSPRRWNNDPNNLPPDRPLAWNETSQNNQFRPSSPHGDRNGRPPWMTESSMRSRSPPPGTNSRWQEPPHSPRPWQDRADSPPRGAGSRQQQRSHPSSSSPPGGSIEIERGLSGRFLDDPPFFNNEGPNRGRGGRGGRGRGRGRGGRGNGGRQGRGNNSNRDSSPFPQRLEQRREFPPHAKFVAPTRPVLDRRSPDESFRHTPMITFQPPQTERNGASPNNVGRPQDTSFRPLPPQVTLERSGPPATFAQRQNSFRSMSSPPIPPPPSARLSFPQHPPVKEESASTQEEALPDNPPPMVDNRKPPPSPPKAPSPPPPSPPPEPSGPSKYVVALTRLADLEAQMEFEFAKLTRLANAGRKLRAERLHVTQLPVGRAAFWDDYEAYTASRETKEESSTAAKVSPSEKQ